MNAWWMWLLLSATPFEGVLHMKVKTSLGEGRVQVSVSKDGVRSEGNIRLGERDLKTTVVVRADAPTVSYLYDSVSDSWRKQEDTPLRADGPYTARKLAPEKVAGVWCQHAMLKDSKGGEIEYWTTRQLVSSPAQVTSLSTAQKTPQDLLEALKSVEAAGFVMKMQSKRQGKIDLSLTTERMERKKLSPGLFSVPASVR